MEFWFMTGLPLELGKKNWQIHQHSEQNVSKVRLINVLLPKNLEETPKMCWEKFRESFAYIYNCRVGCAIKKKLSAAPLRATLGTLRAGSPFRILFQPSLESMSALNAPELSHAVPGSGPKSRLQDQNSKIQSYVDG